MTEQDQEKIWTAAAAASGSLMQFGFMKPLKPMKTALAFFTGCVAGIYGGPALAMLIPGCTRELMLIVVVMTAFLGRIILQSVFQTVEKRSPELVDKAVDAAEEKLRGKRETTTTRSTETQTTHTVEGEEGP